MDASIKLIKNWVSDKIQFLCIENVSKYSKNYIFGTRCSNDPGLVNMGGR